MRSGIYPVLWLSNSVLELAISPSFFRPIFFFFFFFFLKVERGAGAAFGDTAVQRNGDGPQIAEGLPLRTGGKACCVSGMRGSEGFSEAATMESKKSRCRRAPKATGDQGWAGRDPSRRH